MRRCYPGLTGQVNDDAWRACAARYLIDLAKVGMVECRSAIQRGEVIDRRCERPAPAKSTGPYRASGYKPARR